MPEPSEPLNAGIDAGDTGGAAGTAAACCGCGDCRGYVGWRGESSNRRAWKTFCTILLCVYCAGLCYLVRRTPLLLLFAVLMVAKLLVEAWGQDTPTWVVPGGWGLFVAIYVLGLPSFFFTLGACTRDQDIVFPFRDLVGTACFFFGSAFSLSYEVGRFRWKKLEENRGKLHTVGLAAFCIHPNYFGDLFTYSGWAICAGTSCLLSMPIFQIWMFIVFVCPNSDAYLADRYAAQWPEYAQRTATLIPGLRSGIASQLLAWTSFVVSVWLGLRCGGQCG